MVRAGGRGGPHRQRSGRSRLYGHIGCGGRDASKFAAGSKLWGDIYKSPGVPWTCTFDDEFAGTTLDTTKWTAQQTANSGYTTGTGAGTACYVNSPNNVSVSGGTLNVTVRKEAAPFVCSDPFGNFVTQYTSGMVTTVNNLAQTYGLYEINAKLPATTLQGLQETFWLWPQNQNEYGSVWPDSGEIDFAEFYSVVVLRHPLHPLQRGQDRSERHGLQLHHLESQRLPHLRAPVVADLTDRPLRRQDLPGRPLGSGLPGIGSEPFNQPFFIAITQALGVYPNAFTAGYTPLPATTSVAWVKAWS